MTITTSRGKTFDIGFICKPLRNENRVLIDYADDRPIAEIAEDFDGLETITVTDEEKPDKPKPYEGFRELISIHRNKATGTVRLTLERSEGA